MLFSGITFLYYFLPVLLLLYAAVPRNMKNTVLLTGSLFFYAWGEPRYVFLMAVMISVGYGCGILIEHEKRISAKKTVTALSVAFCLVVLFYFKYADFFIRNINSLSGLSVPLVSVTLPIGISFYTFQLISYLVDVYRGEVKAQRNFIRLAVYISMFPQLIAGPIVRYRLIESTLADRQYCASKIAYGIRRFAVGLAKKVIIANTLGEAVALYDNLTVKTVAFSWFYALAATLQIYYDFSGYSDMAIGLGHILGFDFPENFDHPLESGSVTEFWRRWHMTLGSWFRDYLYIPLGGNRVSKIRWFFNILIVWLATGLWHGADWTFLVWGLYFAFWLVAEKLLYKRYLEKIKIFNHIYLLLIVMAGFVIFDAGSLKEAGTTFMMMSGLKGIPALTKESLFYIRDYGFLAAIAFIGAFSAPQRLIRRLLERECGRKVLNILEPLFIAACMILSTAFIINGSFNPFLYFRF